MAANLRPAIDAALAGNPFAQQYGYGPKPPPPDLSDLARPAIPKAAPKGDRLALPQVDLSGLAKPAKQPVPLATTLGEGVNTAGRGLVSHGLETIGSGLRGLSGQMTIAPETAKEMDRLGLITLDPNKPFNEQVETRSPQELGPYKLGETLSGVAKRPDLTPPPGWENSWTNAIAGAFGSTIPFLAAGATGAGGSLVAGTLLGAWSGAGQAMDDAIAHGATKDQILQAAHLGNIPGSTETLPMEVLFERVPLPAMGKFAAVLGHVLATAAAEGGQEGLQQAGQNLVAKWTYDPKRDLMDQVAENAELGAIVGGGAAGAAHLIPGSKEESAPAPLQSEAAVPPAPLEGEVLPPEAPPPPAAPAGAVERPTIDLTANPPPPAVDLPPVAGRQPLRIDLNAGERDRVMGNAPRSIDIPTAPGPLLEPEAAAPALQQLPPPTALKGLPPPAPALTVSAPPPVVGTTDTSAISDLARPAQQPSPTIALPDLSDIARPVRGAGVQTSPAHAATASDVARADAHVAPEPSAAQIAANNAPKGHLRWNGLRISIETAKGGARRGAEPDGTPWEVPNMPVSYGYVRNSRGRDGDHVDVFVGPEPQAPRVFIIDQVDPETGKFDEHKSLIGFQSQEDALRAYQDSFSDGRARERIGAVTAMPVAEFKAWVKSENTHKPVNPRGVAEVRIARQAIARDQRGPEAALPKRPITQTLIREGGVDPTSPLAGELRHIGVNVPGLYRRGGRGAVDNLPARDFPEFGSEADDGHGYLRSDAVLEAIRAEHFGQPLRSPEMQKSIAEHAAANPLGQADEVALDAALREHGLGGDKARRERARFFMADGGMDVDSAVEKAIMEEVANVLTDAEEAYVTEHGGIPFDHEGDGAALGGRGEAVAAQGEPGAQGAAEEGGEAAAGARQPEVEGTNLADLARPAKPPVETPFSRGKRSQEAEYYRRMQEKDRSTDIGAEGKEQTVLEGAEREANKSFLQRKADAPLKPKAAQQGADEGLFGDGHKQSELFKAGKKGRTTARENALAIIKQVAGDDVAVNFAHKIFPGAAGSVGMSKWGAAATDEAAGSANKLDRIINISLNPEFETDNTAYHEAYHLIEDLKTKAERDLIRRELPRLRKIVAKDMGLSAEEVASVAPSEIEAQAFAAYAQGKDKGMHAGIRAFFAKVLKIIRRIRNMMQGLGFKTVDDYYDAGLRGEVQARGLEGEPETDEAFLPAWHGSPHRFDKFSLEHIGKGEGAQAYGWGLYFAGKKEIAEYYRDKLSSRSGPRWDIAKSWLDDAKGDTEKAVALFQAFANGARLTKGEIADTIKAIRDVNARGALYRVELSPAEDEYLDWDKPLSEQSEKVKAGLRTLGVKDYANPTAAIEKDNPFASAMKNVGLPEKTGMRAYHELAAEKSYAERRRSWNKWGFTKAQREARSRAAYKEAWKHGQEFASDALHAAGIRGIRYLDGTSRTAGDGTHNYVVFSDDDIKIEEQFSPGKRKPRRDPTAFFDTPEDRIRLRRFLQVTSLGMLRRGVNSTLTRRKLQDRAISMRDMQDAITVAGGSISEDTDLYLAESLYYGRTGEKIFELRTRYVDPLVTKMAGYGIDRADLDEFLYALHAAERNAAIRQRDPTNTEGSGMSDAEARAILRRRMTGNQARRYLDLADDVKRIVRRSRETLFNAGLIDQDTLDAWGQAYANYVPLRGWEGEDIGEGPRSGRGFDVRGPEAQAATGRHSRADSPLAYTIMQAQQSIVRAEKNRVAQMLGRLAVRYPNKQVWEVNKVELKKRINPSTGLVDEYWLNPQAQPKENIVIAKSRGKATYITVHHEGLLNAMRMSGAESMGRLLAGVGRFTRVVASLYTTFDPDFVLRNLSRDTQESMLHLSEHKRKGLRRAVLRDMPAAATGMFRYLRGDEGNAHVWLRHAREFAQSGGKISFFNQESLEDQKKALDRALSAQSPITALEHGRPDKAALAAFHAVGGFIEDINGSVENAIRLSIFVNLRRAGISQSQAASAAREITVNFNRKGEWSSAINVLYLFSNATVQGGFRQAQFAKRAPRTFMKAALAMAVLGAGADWLNYILAGEDPKDGMNFWDKVPDYDKQRNFIIMQPGTGKYLFKFPMLYGYNIWPTLGGSISAAVRHGAGAGNGMEPLDAALNVLTSTVNAYSPLDLATGLQALVPTAFSPLVEIWRNKDWKGSPITPPKSDDKQPNADLFYRGVNPVSKEVAKELERFTTYDARKPAAIDISPEWIDHIWGTYMGGAGQFWVNRIGGNIYKIMQGEPIDTKDIPFLRTFRGEVGDYVNTNIYYNLSDDVLRINDLLQAARSDAERQAVRERYPVEASVAGDFVAADRILGKLRRVRKQTEGDPNLSADVRKSDVQKVETEMAGARDRARAAWETARKRLREAVPRPQAN